MKFHPVNFKRLNNLKFKKMKKFSTLVLASLFTVAAFAADRKPSVTVQSSKKYEIVIDGKSYQSSNAGIMNINNLRDGRHTITVYEANRGFFNKRLKRVLSSASFTLRNNDINIFIDQSGRAIVKESRFGKMKGDRGWDDDDSRFDKNPGRDKDRDFDKNDKQDRNKRF